MSKMVKTLLVASIGACFMMTTAVADVDKGQKYFSNEMRKACGFSGNVMAKKHTQAEWKAINDAGKLSEELQTICPSAKPLKDIYLNDVFDFLFNYASDSGNSPIC